MKTTRKDANRAMRQKCRSAAVEFGEWFRELRLSHGLRGSRLSIKAGQHRTYVSALERGCANPKVETLFAIAIAMGLDKTERGELLRRAFSGRSQIARGLDLVSIIADCPTCSQRVADALRNIKRTKKDCPPATIDAPACEPCEAVE